MQKMVQHVGQTGPVYGQTNARDQSMTTDPYEALGLTRSATADEIKKAHRKLVRTSHPDLHPDDPGAEDRFKAIANAYDLLKDPETRARFDAGEIDAQGAERPPRQYYRDFADAPDDRYQQRRGFGADVDPADIFAEILRQQGRGGGAGSGGDPFGGGYAAAGGDARYTLEVRFLDAVQGSETRITLPDGQTLAVKIPQGLEDGQTLRLRGKGAPGFGGGPAGDALVTVMVRAHPAFRREGDDILLTLPITFDEAILGAKVTVPTIGGPVGLTIPPGASSGRVMRLRGRGVARAGRKTTGDQLVELKVVVPKDPDPALHDFLSEWRKTHAFDPRADLMKGAGT
jgi:DnaJ-class molecular chaperone